MPTTYVSDAVYTRPSYYTGYAIAHLVDIFIGIIEISLALRFVLKLLGASTASPFVSWIFDITTPLIAPFANMFAAPLGVLVTFELGTLIAIVAYAVLGWVALYAIQKINKTGERLVFR